MKESKDQLEQIIKNEYDRLAQEEENDIQADDTIEVPEGTKESLRAKIDQQIEEMKKEKIYAQLSEEDRKALELGRKIMAEEEQEKTEAKVVHKKKRFKMYFGLAAVLILVMAVGITSIGGPERIVRMLKQAVGDREVEKVTSGEDSMTIVEENEEKAYEKIKEVFGVEPVKLTQKVEKMKFNRMELDEEMQIAELFYEYKGENIVYFINASYADASLGIDVEDEVVNNSKKNIEGCEIEIKEYRTPSTNTERYSAKFKYNGLEYFLVGTMEKEAFDIIINNLFFYK
ncbi:DUF4367 domain-containing protein [Faecalicatena contorta]|uniref:DUF4367 domain-containing protein n=1 Tax=Lachnospiraceae TaxID=186803 RepID=UPI001F1DF155|nr:DUF4367 domain-containing protein [Faecalicatena contorta]MCF2669026.1 DUF4367 domain-containing protein [Faecalicatena contorta]